MADYDQAPYISKSIEQDLADLASEGLEARIRKAQSRRWRLEQAKQRLAELEALNARAIERLGDPTELRRRMYETLQRHREEKREFEALLRK